MTTPIDILLVDDSPGDLMFTREALGGLAPPNRLHTVTDGVEAMAFLRRQGSHADAPRPDLILLDLNMPRMDGREVLRELKTDENLQSIPVVILTTSESELDLQACYQARCNSFITKPVTLDDFMKTIGEMYRYWTCVARMPPANSIYNGVS